MWKHGRGDTGEVGKLACRILKNLLQRTVIANHDNQQLLSAISANTALNVNITFIQKTTPVRDKSRVDVSNDSSFIGRIHGAIVVATSRSDRHGDDCRDSRLV